MGDGVGSEPALGAQSGSDLILTAPIAENYFTFVSRKNFAMASCGFALVMGI
jgi:hypothetical protein